MITGDLQHNEVIVDIDRRLKKQTEWKPGSQKRNLARL